MLYLVPDEFVFYTCQFQLLPTGMDVREQDGFRYSWKGSGKSAQI